jgi:hypothetical protein
MYRLLFEYLIRTILSEEEFTNLNVRSFRGASHKNRTDKFVDFLQSGHPIPLKKGEDSVVVKSVEVIKDGKSTTYDPTTQADELKAILPELKSGDKLYLYDEGGKKYSITAIAKTADLGGRGKGNVAGGGIEAKQETAMKAKLDGRVVTLQVLDAAGESHSYNGINGFERIPGNKKADFKFTSEAGNDIYVQHKDPKHQQLAGVVRGALKDDDQVDAFVKRVYDEVKANGQLKKRIVEPITDKTKQLLAMYGTADGSFSEDAVEMYCIGDMKLDDINENTVELKANKIYIYPEIPTDDPIVLAATYRSGRNHKSKYGLIEDVRIGLYFKSSLGSLDS